MGAGPILFPRDSLPAGAGRGRPGGLCGAAVGYWYSESLLRVDGLSLFQQTVQPLASGKQLIIDRCFLNSHHGGESKTAHFYCKEGRNSIHCLGRWGAGAGAVLTLQLPIGI